MVQTTARTLDPTLPVFIPTSLSRGAGGLFPRARVPRGLVGRETLESREQRNAVAHPAPAPERQAESLSDPSRTSPWVPDSEDDVPSPPNATSRGPRAATGLLPAGAAACGPGPSALPSLTLRAQK